MAQEDIQFAHNLLVNRDYETARGFLRDVLAKDPLNAQAWVFLGECLEHLGAYGDSWAAYDRGWFLDPVASWAEPVWNRLQGRKDSDGVSHWMTELLAVPRVTVSAALIVKDEMRTIEAVLQSLRGAVDEVIVVDTGSTDGTTDIARANNVKVYEYPWTGDFSAARNFALSKVTSEWVLWVDGDEVLFDEDLSAPRLAAGLFDSRAESTIIRIGQFNLISGRVEPNYDMSRMFAKRSGFIWHGRIHEQVGPPEGVLSAVVTRPAVRIRVRHDGYDPAIMSEKGKLARNIELLKKSVEDDPTDIASWGFLGRELSLAGQFEEAVRALEKVEELRGQFPYYGRLNEVRTYRIETLQKLGRQDAALRVADMAVQEDPNFPAMWYLRGASYLALALKYLDVAEESFNQAKQTLPRYRGIVSMSPDIGRWKIAAGLADIYKIKGRMADAFDLYQEALGAVDREGDTAQRIREQMNKMLEEAQKLHRLGGGPL